MSTMIVPAAFFAPFLTYISFPSTPTVLGRLPPKKMPSSSPLLFLKFELAWSNDENVGPTRNPMPMPSCRGPLDEDDCCAALEAKPDTRKDESLPKMGDCALASDGKHSKAVTPRATDVRDTRLRITNLLR